jgi:tetratricopeptide (TPR) repeat protein
MSAERCNRCSGRPNEGGRQRIGGRWLAAILLAFTAACAPKTAPPVIPGAERFPEFAFPAPPPGLGTEATLERHKAGWQWLQVGDLKAAERNFSASLKLFPEFYPAEVGLAYTALARKDHNTALVHFDRAIVANPRFVPALVGRGDALLAVGQRREALTSFEAAAAADPNQTALRSRIEVLRFRGLQEDVAEARKAAESGRRGEARKLYAQAITVSPESPFLYRELAAVERDEGDLDGALAHARKSTELEPGDVHGHTLVGEILEARGDLNGALQAYQTALAIEPNDALEKRIEHARETAALAAMPAEFKLIEGSPTVTREQLAALIGVRLDDLLKRSARNQPVVITDTRGSWATPWILTVARSGIMEVYPNHTFQPSSIVRRGDLASAASHVLSLIASEKPALASTWRTAERRRFVDISPGHLSYPAVSLTVEAGVLEPGPDGSFQLTRPATGAEAVEAVRKLEELADRPSR